MTLANLHATSEGTCIVVVLDDDEVAVQRAAVGRFGVGAGVAVGCGRLCDGGGRREGAYGGSPSLLCGCDTGDACADGCHVTCVDMWWRVVVESGVGWKRKEREENGKKAKKKKKRRKAGEKKARAFNLCAASLSLRLHNRPTLQLVAGRPNSGRALTHFWSRWSIIAGHRRKAIAGRPSQAIAGRPSTATVSLIDTCD